MRPSLHCYADPGLRDDLARAIGRRVPDADVEDVVQATLLEILRAGLVPRDREHARRIAFAVARHKVADLHRRRIRARETFELPEIGMDGPSEPHADLLDWARYRLPPGRNAMRTLEWMLREADGEPLEDIARRERLEATVVRKRVSRLRAFFRKRWLKEVALLAIALVAFVVVILWARSRHVAPATQPPTAPSIVPSVVPSSAPTIVPSASPSVAPAPHAARRPQTAAPVDSSNAASLVSGWTVVTPSKGPTRRIEGVAAAIQGEDIESCGAKQSDGTFFDMTFEQDGTVSNVTMKGPLDGTPEGACIAGHLKRLRVRPFLEPRVTLRRMFPTPPPYVPVFGNKHGPPMTPREAILVRVNDGE